MAERLTERQRRRFNNIRETKGKESARAFRREKLGLDPASEPKSRIPNRGSAPNMNRRPKAKGTGLRRPGKLIDKQQQFNEWNAQQQHYLNRPNEYNPYGSQEYRVDPETGQIIKESSLSAPQQQNLEQRQNIDYQLGQGVQNMMGQMGQPFQFNNPYNPQQMSGWEGRQKLTDQQYGRAKTVLDDRFSQEKDQMMQSLADRGIPEGSDLYNKELMEFDRRKSDAYDQAYTSASQFGGQEQVNQFNMGMTGQQNAFSNQMQQYQLPYQTAGSMLGMQQGIINPQFTPMSQVNMPGTDVTGVGLGFANMQNQKDIAGMNKGGGGGGGGYSAPQPMQYAPPQQQQSQSPWPGVVGAIGSGLATGLGMGLFN